MKTLALRMMLIASLLLCPCCDKSTPLTRSLWIYSIQDARADQDGSRRISQPVARIESDAVIAAFDALPEADPLTPSAPPLPIPNSPWLIVVDASRKHRAAWLLHVDGTTLWRYDKVELRSDELIFDQAAAQIDEDTLAPLLARELAPSHSKLFETYELLRSDPFSK